MTKEQIDASVAKARLHLTTPKTNSEVRARSEVIVALADEIERYREIVDAAVLVADLEFTSVPWLKRALKAIGR